MNQSIDDWRGVLAESHRALRTAVAGVGSDAWDKPTPCERWTVAQVFQHATGDQHGFASILTGGPGPDFNPFRPSGVLDGDPAAYLDRVLTDADAAWKTVADNAEHVPSPIPGPPQPAWVVAGSAALDAAVHAWDIAVATGRPSPLTPHTAQQLMLVARLVVDGVREYGAYAAAIATKPGADEVTVLLAYLGRHADWRP
ncbi:MAG: TIGR03086 family metal-binding protein [Stackebrandtia sp.]